MRITAHEPFDFQRTLRFVLSPPALLNGRLFEPLLDHFGNGEYRRAADLSGQPVLYAVREVNPVSSKPARRDRYLSESAGLDLKILAGPRDETTRRTLAEFVQRQFSTDLDLTPFYRLAASDRVLSRLVRHFGGMRIPQAPLVYETLISAILEQQVNLSFAHHVKKALVQAYGSSIEFEGNRYNAFPEPAALAITT